ncbi:MAG: efflux transporter outer membrane subunit [Xanthomonadaceae bacterium]|nr:efflux transporter outer membrane subunit [Xanthomonadaceae bacterium]
MSRCLVAPPVLLAILLAGCAAPPSRPPPSLRAQAPLAGVPADRAAAWPAADWWTRYRDPQLDRLVQRALANSPSLAAAEARVRGAEALAGAQAALGGARLDANAQIARQRLSENGLIPPRFLGFTWYTQSDLGLQFRYDFDFWGKRRAETASALDQARAALAERHAAALVLSSAVTADYFGWQADHSLLAEARRLQDIADAQQRIAEARVAQGTVSGDSADQAAAQTAAARQRVSELEGALAQDRAGLAALLGIAPADLPALQPRALPQPIAALPADAGLDLIARRPDIVAGRWRVEAAGEQVKAARADFYPDISLGALAGLSSLRASRILSAGSRVFDLAPAVHLPIFDGGLLKARYGYSRAQLAAAIASYNQSVIDAAHEVARSAIDVQRLAAERREQAVQLAAIEHLAANARARARQGLTDAGPELAAASQLATQRSSALVLQAQALTADIALTKALGGGYHARSPRPSGPAAATSVSTPGKVPAP